MVSTAGTSVGGLCAGPGEIFASCVWATRTGLLVEEGVLDRSLELERGGNLRDED